MYNKKLEGMYGALDLVSPSKNLLVVDISGSIPKGVSSTLLALSKSLSETFYADLLITGSKSTLYAYEELYKLEDLNSQNTSSVDNGNIQGLVSNWTDTDDNSHEMVDVWFKTQEVSQNTISETSAWTTSTVSEVNNQSYVVYANTQIVIDEEAKSQNII